MAKARLATLVIWGLLTGFAGYIYWNAGVVRDVPELGISVQNRHRRMNVEYTERGYQYDRPFSSADKAHWLVIGNSFGRDFVNTILESAVADRVEVSFVDDYMKPSRDGRYVAADRVFIASRGISGGYVSAIEVQCWQHGLSPEKIVIVGDKSFGEHNGHVYARRHRPDYYEQRVPPLGGTQFLERNDRFRAFYGDRFLDMMALVTNDAGLVQVFTPEHRFISADGKHLTRAGAQFFAERIDLELYMQ